MIAGGDSVAALPNARMRMIRPISNPPNPYCGEHVAYLDDPPPDVRIEVFEERVRTILAENESPDIPFRFSVNPYRGCQHACAYCYARLTHEYLGFGAGTDFDSRIVVKINAAEALDAELRSRRLAGERIAFSGVTDCYQPLETVFRLTRACLETCLRRGFGVSIVTKSYLIVRDRELLAAFQHRGGMHVYFSIPFSDDAMARKVEPGAPPPSRRFAAMKLLSDARIPVSVLVAPVVPGLNDRQIPAVLERAAECGASSAGMLPLRLPGSVAPVFLERVRGSLPHHAERIEALHRGGRRGRLNDPRFGSRMRAVGAYWETIYSLFEKSAARFGLNRSGDGSTLEECRGSTHAAARAPAGGRGGSVQLPLFGGD